MQQEEQRQQKAAKIRNMRREEGFDLGDGSTSSSEVFKTTSNERYADPKVVYKRESEPGKRNKSQVEFGDGSTSNGSNSSFGNYVPSAFDHGNSNNGAGKSRAEMIDKRHKELASFVPHPKSKSIEESSSITPSTNDPAFFTSDYQTENHSMMKSVARDRNDNVPFSNSFQNRTKYHRKSNLASENSPPSKKFEREALLEDIDNSTFRHRSTDITFSNDAATSVSAAAQSSFDIITGASRNSPQRRTDFRRKSHNMAEDPAQKDHTMNWRRDVDIVSNRKL